MTRAPAGAAMPGMPTGTAQGEPTVILRGLEKRFGDFTAVNKVSLEVGKGEIFGFLGPNGAGKSTTIRMLCGILPPTAGSGTVAGYDITRQPEEIKKNIGYMSQKFSLYEDLTVEENIDFYSGIYRIPSEKKSERKEWVLRMAGLERHRGSGTSTLSGGWKQRLALGCAILHEPPIVFLDEPTSGVDPLSRRNFWELIYHLSAEGVTVFLTTHYMDEAEYCDRLGLIYRGELVAQGTPGQLKTAYMAEEVLEISCSAPQEAMRLISSLPGVGYASLFGSKLHVVASKGEHAPAELRGLLEQAGMRVDAVEPVLPTLEDVFVSLIEARDRQEGAQREFAV